MRLILINAPAGFVKELSQRGHEMIVVDSSVEMLASQITNPKCHFKQLWGRRKINIAAIREMRAMIRSFEPDLLHAFLPSSLAQAMVGSMGLRRRPKLVSFRGITRVPRWLDPSEWITYLSPRVHMHACESLAVKQAMIKGGIRDERCAVTYNCLPPILPATRDDARSRFGIPRHAFVVGTLACIRPVKRIDLMLRAGLECLPSIPDIYFLLLGEQKDSRVAQLAKDPRFEGRLVMPGHLPSGAQWLQAMDLFVMPSRREGLCRALLEAMDQGVCSIVSDAGGMKEMVRNQVDGVVVPEGSHLAIRDAIECLYHKPEQREQFGASAQSRVRDICSPESFANRLESIYMRLCEGSS